MSDTYNYEEGAIHNDHKKVLHIGTVGSDDIGKLIGAFFKDDAEEAEVDEIDEQVSSKQVETKTGRPNGIPEEPNYFAPQKNLSVFLCQDWFDECSSNKKKYSCEWREGLMEALLESEYKDEIAKEWLQEGKRSQMKCAIVGILIDAKVLKGSYRSVGAKLGLDDVKSASLARYMSKAPNQPYYEWLKAFAEN